jgi:hypothetical protein
LLRNGNSITDSKTGSLEIFGEPVLFQLGAISPPAIVFAFAEVFSQPVQAPAPSATPQDTVSISSSAKQALASNTKQASGADANPGGENH